MSKPPICGLDFNPVKPPKEYKYAFRLFSKGIYSPGVKTHGWEFAKLDAEAREQPPEKMDYLTEFKAKFVGHNVKPVKFHQCRMNNFYSYTGEEPIEDSLFLKQQCFTDYVTTMQKSFKSPHPCVMQRISMPATPFFLNRKMTMDIKFSPYKFYDEEYFTHMKRLQHHKMQRSVSFNPLVGKYTDGST